MRYAAGRAQPCRATGISVAVVLIAAAVVPMQARAAISVGNDLSPAPTVADPCESTASCTITNLGLPDDDPSSPIDGVVVRWRVRAASTDPAGVQLRLRVIRDAGEGEYGIRNTSVTRRFSATPVATTTFVTRQRISEGDLIGLDVEPPGAGLTLRTAAAPGAELGRWEPPLAPGELRAPDTTPSGEATFNADVEPDADSDGFGDDTQDFCVGIPGNVNGCDGNPPETTITKAPGKHVKTRDKRKRVRFEFTSSEPEAVFRCVIDGGYGVACESPFKRKMKRGKHSFEVQAIDPTGVADPTPAVAGFAVKRKR
jgi:hypothetical protein